jgi:hypothetical protein
MAHVPQSQSRQQAMRQPEAAPPTALWEPRISTSAINLAMLPATANLRSCAQSGKAVVPLPNLSDFWVSNLSDPVQARALSGSRSTQRPKGKFPGTPPTSRDMSWNRATAASASLRLLCAAQPRGEGGRRRIAVLCCYSSHVFTAAQRWRGARQIKYEARHASCA